MTKQEEIRKVIDAYTDDKCLYPDNNCEFRGSDVVGGYCVSGGGSYRCLMKRLDELDVVIKVDRELPEWVKSKHWNTICGNVYIGTQQDMLKAGYVAVEPLIKEE